jgi:branched-chain amino acid transport system permease protein
VRFRIIRALWTPAALIAAVIVLALIAGSTNASPALINLMLVIGLYVFAGNSGVLSFGHVAFMAIGAYACALITIPTQVKSAVLPNLPGLLAHTHVSTTAAVLIAAALAGVAGYLVSLPLMRLSGLAAGIATLALLVIVTDFLTNDTSLTGGNGNLSGIPSELGLTTLLVWSCVAIVIALLYQRSRFCRRLRAAREDEIAARSLGIRVERERRIAFTLSAVITGGAGALYAQYLGSIGPASFGLSIRFVIIAMLIIGGMRSLTGAVAGAVLLSVVTTALNNWEQGQSVLGISLSFLPAATTELVVAAMMILVLVLRPDGVSGGREVPWPFTEPPR